VKNCKQDDVFAFGKYLVTTKMVDEALSQCDEGTASKIRRFMFSTRIHYPPIFSINDLCLSARHQGVHFAVGAKKHEHVKPFHAFIQTIAT
jgi:hypothetical protein